MDTITREEVAELPVPEGALRKPVSDEQLRSAMANPNNSNVVKKVLNKFARSLNEDDLHRCGLHALWKTLAYHDETFGQKFTTSLYRFTHWECKREIRHRTTMNKATVSLDDMGDIAYEENQSDPEHGENLGLATECFSLMKKADQDILKEYYLDGWTMEEIGALHNMSKEAVRQKLALALRTAQHFRDELQPSVYSDDDE